MATQIGGIAMGNGVNLQPSYYNGGNVNFGWALMQQQSAIKSVRIEIEPFIPAATAASWISAAQSYGYQVIATYHKCAAIGSNDINELLAAANWWKSNYNGLGSSFTINLMNEWGDHYISAADYADAYNQAIAIVRQVYAGPIIIDAAGGGQEVNTLYDAVQPGSALITDTNIVLSAHIYKGSWNHATGNFLTTADLDNLNSAGLPCIAAEFGPIGNPTDTCDWENCVEHVKGLGWTVIGWCWNGDGNGFNMVNPPWSSATGSTATNFTLNHPYFDTIYNHLVSVV